MAKREKDPVVERLDKVIKLLQDLVILEAVKEEVNTNQLRGIVGVDKARVNKVSSLVRTARKKAARKNAP